jgi:hypothetical protein
MKRRRIVVLSYLIISGAIIFLVGSSLGTEIFRSWTPANCSCT